MMNYQDLDLARALELVDPESDGYEILKTLSRRINAETSAQERFRQWCYRADLLYYAETFTNGGADLWSDDPTADLPGRSHVSVNTPSAYVDIPAALQAFEPVETMVPTDTTKEARAAAAALERLYYAWKGDGNYELLFHKACTVKGLYGRTAAKVYYDVDKKKPCVEIVEQPRNLYLGYKSDSYNEVEWAAYVTRVEPNAVIEEFGVDVVARTLEGANGTVGVVVPFVQIAQEQARSSRQWLNFGDARIGVWDYWYRQPVWKGKKFVRMDTYNIVFAGNQVVRGPIKYSDYKGTIPYFPLYNTFIPGDPDGRADLYDMEPMIREKFERITSGSQMIAGGVAGDYWQLTGPEAPSRVPAGLKPIRNQVVAPGAGNRIETITPFIAQFQLEQYFTRLDREMAVISGLNDLLLGLAPASVLSSSKAMNALIANYETRLEMRRKLLYAWRKDVWAMCVQLWVNHDKTVKLIVDSGGGVLDITDPTLSPRDEMETATRAANLVNAKLWSQRRGMDAVHVDDPQSEQDMIREERTDATMFPADVQIMVQLLAALNAENQQPNAATQDAANQQASSASNALRGALGQATPNNTNGSQLPGDQGMTPPIPGQPQEAGGAPQPFAQGPSGAGQDKPPLLQGRLIGGKASSRILTQNQL